MASALSEKLSRLVKQMRGQARITEENVQEMLREVRMALLEADVALPVVREFIANIINHNGITRTDMALEQALTESTPATGMRGPEVPKVVLIISDGEQTCVPLYRMYRVAHKFGYTSTILNSRAFCAE